MKPQIKASLAVVSVSTFLVASSVGCRGGAQGKAAEIAVGGYVGAVAVHDLNADGHLDIIAARSDATNLGEIGDGA